MLKRTLSILGLASTLIGATAAQAHSTATAEAQQGSTWHRGGYTDGFRDGYRQGSRDGYEDGLSGQPRIRTPDPDGSSQSAYERGYSDGYSKGYQGGLRRAGAAARPERPE
jgi:flagellar biosynthesis/type III secretory pathway protein FliH